MLKRISAGCVSAGMYIHSFEGNWIDHPFWRARLLVADEATAGRIRAAGIFAVTIDEARGAPARCRPLGPDSTKPCGCRQRAAAPDATAPAPLPRLAPGEAQEVAIALIARTRGAIQALYEEAHGGVAPTAAMLAPLVRDVTECVERSREVLNHLGLLKKKHEYTFLHSLSVCGYMVNFARELGFDDDGVMRLGMAGLMHDLGKSAIDESILMKPGRLTAEEFDVIRGHPSSGHELLQSSDDLPEEVLSVCLQHHERLDGKGYPHGLSGAEISLAVRMSTICDVYDALTSARPYKDAWLPARALREMRGSPGQFDQELLRIFADSLRVPDRRARRTG